MYHFLSNLLATIWLGSLPVLLAVWNTKVFQNNIEFILPGLFGLLLVGGTMELFYLRFVRNRTV